MPNYFVLANNRNQDIISFWVKNLEICRLQEIQVHRHKYEIRKRQDDKKKLVYSSEQNEVTKTFL